MYNEPLTLQLTCLVVALRFILFRVSMYLVKPVTSCRDSACVFSSYMSHLKAQNTGRFFHNLNKNAEWYTVLKKSLTIDANKTFSI